MSRLESGLSALEHGMSFAIAGAPIAAKKSPVLGAVLGLTVSPLVGLLLGPARIVLGVAQLVTAATSFIFTAAYAAVTGNSEPLFCSINHAIHGLGNIIRGGLETIPIVQVLMNKDLVTPILRRGCRDFGERYLGEPLGYAVDGNRGFDIRDALPMLMYGPIVGGDYDY